MHDTKTGAIVITMIFVIATLILTAIAVGKFMTTNRVQNMARCDKQCKSAVTEGVLFSVAALFGLITVIITSVYAAQIPPHNVTQQILYGSAV